MAELFRRFNLAPLFHDLGMTEVGAGPVAGVTQLHGDVPTHRMDVGDGSHSSVLGGRDQGLQLELLHGTDRGKVPGQQGLGLLTEAGGQFGQSGVSIGFHVN